MKRKLYNWFGLFKRATTIELFEVLLENKQLFKNGLCAWIMEVMNKDLITNKECKLLRSYLRENIPKRTYTFSWEVGLISPRVEWINMQIETLKNK
jgi:phage antirepressor YoqD-like protein